MAVQERLLPRFQHCWFVRYCPLFLWHQREQFGCRSQSIFKNQRSAELWILWRCYQNALAPQERASPPAELPCFTGALLYVVHCYCRYLLSGQGTLPPYPVREACRVGMWGSHLTDADYMQGKMWSQSAVRQMPSMACCMLGISMLPGQLQLHRAAATVMLISPCRRRRHMLQLLLLHASTTKSIARCFRCSHNCSP
jgi:hypothetical protein